MDGKINLFISWARTFTAFHIFGRFKDWDADMVDYLEKNFNPKNKRDLRMKRTIIDFNRNRLSE